MLFAYICLWLLICTWIGIFLFFFSFWERFLICSCGWPGTHKVEQSGIKLRDLHTHVFRVLGLKEYTTTPNLPPAPIWKKSRNSSHPFRKQFYPRKYVLKTQNFHKTSESIGVDPYIHILCLILTLKPTGRVSQRIKSIKKKKYYRLEALPE